MEFEAIEFGYGQGSALIIPSLRIAAGEKIAIIGENGAGKSTLARLIPRVYDVRQGSIYVGRQDIRKIGLKSLRRRSAIFREIRFCLMARSRPTYSLSGPGHQIGKCRQHYIWLISTT